MHWGNIQEMHLENNLLPFYHFWEWSLFIHNPAALRHLAQKMYPCGWRQSGWGSGQARLQRSLGMMKNRMEPYGEPYEGHFHSSPYHIWEVMALTLMHLPLWLISCLTPLNKSSEWRGTEWNLKVSISSLYFFFFFPILERDVHFLTTTCNSPYISGTLINYDS